MDFKSYVICNVSIVVIFPILLMGILRLTEVKYLSQNQRSKTCTLWNSSLVQSLGFCIYEVAFLVELKRAQPFYKLKRKKKNPPRITMHSQFLITLV